MMKFTAGFASCLGMWAVLFGAAHPHYGVGVFLGLAAILLGVVYLLQVEE
jgi:hypothetical protein